jgi:hypothetical protein
MIQDERTAQRAVPTRLGTAVSLFPILFISKNCANLSMGGWSKAVQPPERLKNYFWPLGGLIWLFPGKLLKQLRFGDSAHHRAKAAVLMMTIVQQAANSNVPLR